MRRDDALDHLRFRIYRRVNGHLEELYNINRTPSGLYLDPTRRPAVFARGAKADQWAFSYHEDGRSWDKRGRKHGANRKTVEQPLTTFTGAQTISQKCCTMGNGEMFPLEQEVVLQSDDIIIERAAPYGLEIMVCDKVIELEPKPGRLNSAVYVKDQVFPVIIIEAFDLATPTLLPVRFERLNPLIEGENLFFDHQGRI